MGINYNPRTVTDGLVLALDAGNAKSYPGSGTTWSDLSGNGNNGSLVNMDGANLDSANGGSLTFDGSNEYVEIPANDACNFNTGDFALEAWINRNSIADNSIIAGRGPTNGTLMLAVYFNDMRIGRNLVFWDAISPNLSWNIGQWYHLVATRSSGTIYLYRDTQLVYSAANNISYNFTVSPNTNFIIGGRQNNSNSSNVGQKFSGKIPKVQVYNKALTPAEIKQNFNALRGRFGI